MKKIIVSFKPVATPDAVVLILGSMPGAESLRKNEYYANSRNQFWKIIFGIFKQEPVREYSGKLDFLKEKKIALWDVFKRCTREGSLDSSIKNATPNNFKVFLNKHTDVKHIFCNGKTAYINFKRSYPDISERINCTALPSTSPANTISFAEKIKEWKLIKEVFLTHNFHKSISC